MAQLGFVTFQVHTRDFARGSRGREFERPTLGRRGQYEIPEHLAVLRNLARTRPYMDLERVGVMGGSYSGYLSLRAMLQRPDDYHVGVAVAPITDLYTHGIGSSFGPPQDAQEAYEAASNIGLAENLKGKLLLIHGTYDRFVLFSHTLKMVDALTKSNKRFDLIVLPEWGHFSNGTQQLTEYRLESYRRHFVEHLGPDNK